MTVSTGAFSDRTRRSRARGLAARPSLPLELTGVLGTLLTLLGLAALVVCGVGMETVELLGPLEANLLLGLVWLLIGLLGLAAFPSTPPASRGYLRGAGLLFGLLTLGGLASGPLFGLLPLGGALPLHAVAA